jgi:lysophospholipase L1-like esterase
MSEPITKKLKLLAVNFTVFAGILILLELGVRLFMPFVQSQKIDASLFTDDRIPGSSALTPDAEGKAFGKKVRIDQYGFRMDGTVYQRGQRSWLFLGDSVTFGVGVEDEQTFAAIIDLQTDEVNILNPSVPGYTCDDYANVLKALIPNDSFNLEQVFVFYCLNDLYMKKGTDLQSSRSGIVKEVTAFFRGHSMMYNWLKALVANRPKTYYEYDASFYQKDNPSFLHAIERLQFCDSLCAAHNIGFSVMPMPYSYQFTDDLNDPFKPQQLLEAELKRMGIQIINGPQEAIAKSFSKHPDKAYLFGDGIHFSLAGHIEVANHFLMEVIWDY